MINSQKIYSQRDERRGASLLFWAGLFSMARISIGGSLAITELAFICATPFVVTREMTNFRRDGILPLISLLVLWLLGAIFADIYNGINFIFSLKGIATPVVYLCNAICLYHLLRRNVKATKWFVLGCALSYVLSTFVFQRASTVNDELSLEEAIDKTVAYKLYWKGLMDHFILLPVRGWFISTPYLYCILSIGGLAAYALHTGARSGFLALVVSLVLVHFGKQSRTGGQFIRRHFIFIGVVLLGAMMGAKYLYQYSVTKGYLGEEEKRKYEMQTRGSSSALHLIMAGRIEFFVGGYAASQHPIVGRGSWALDYDGLYLEFLNQYGAPEDFARAVKFFENHPGAIRRIPAHSHIMTYWMWHGVFGFVFWAYVLAILIKALVKDLGAIPELYGYFSLGIPIFVWDIMFSPAGNRVPESAIIILCLLAQKFANGRHFNNLPIGYFK